MNRARAVILSVAILAVPALAGQPAASPPKKSALDKATLEAYLRRLELWPPQIQVRIGELKPFTAGLYSVEVHLSAGQASKNTVYYVSRDGGKVIRGSAHDINQNPFQSDVDLLKTDQQPSFGSANAPLTLVLFSDFQCPICKEEAKTLRENLPKHFPNDVRVFFKDMPLEAIHPWAKPAAIAGRCVFREKPAAFWDYHDWIYEHQGEMKPETLRAKVADWAKAKGLDVNRLGQCIDTRATEAEVDREIAEGKKLEIDSTPTAFLNERRLVGHIPWDNMIQILKLELEFRKQ